MVEPSKPILISLKHIISVKLNEENHLLLKQQAVVAIRGHNLLYFLESTSKPDWFLDPQNKVSGNISTKYLSWEYKDQLILVAIFNVQKHPKKDGRLRNSLPDLDKAKSPLCHSKLSKFSQFEVMLQWVKKGSLSINELKIKKHGGSPCISRSYNLLFRLCWCNLQ